MVRKIFYESTVYTYIDFHSKIFILSEIGFRAVNKESQNTQILCKFSRRTCILYGFSTKINSIGIFDLSCYKKY